MDAHRTAVLAWVFRGSLFSPVVNWIHLNASLATASKVTGSTFALIMVYSKGRRIDMTPCPRDPGRSTLLG
jgi:hypothetical protein